MPKHIHAELIKQWADGAEIQREVEKYYYNGDQQWIDDTSPLWLPEHRYRLKPKPKTIKYKDYMRRVTNGSVYFYRVETHNYDNVCSDKDQAGQPNFVKWIDTEWQEVEVPE